MESIRRHILITGLPGIGKTTLIKKLSEALKPLHPVGFYTDEIREGGVRKGFELVSFDGTQQILSHVDVKSSFRVGKYRVDITGFEAFLEAIDFLGPASRLIIIDEIGKMECLSEKFRIFLNAILNSDKPLIATIALKGGGIIQQVKQRPDTTIFVMNSNNRDSILSEILVFFGK